MNNDANRMYCKAILHDLTQKINSLYSYSESKSFDREDVGYLIGEIVAMTSQYWHIIRQSSEIENSSELIDWMRRSVPDLYISGQPFRIVPADCHLPQADQA